METESKIEKEINLIIDGQSVTVPDGSTILKAAQQAGIRVPTLCLHPSLSPIGACRTITLLTVRHAQRTVIVSFRTWPMNMIWQPRILMNTG